MDSDAIFLLDQDGSLEKIPHRNYDREDILQKLISKHPELIVGEQIDPDSPPRWLHIKSEAGVPGQEAGGDRWSVDNLLLDQTGIPTFVEVKRSSDTRIRREVVGQMLDYAANAVVYWPADKIRSLAEAQYGGVEGLNKKIREFLSEGQEPDSVKDVDAYWSSVSENLKSGKVRLLFVADIIPTELRRVIEFLNEHMPLVEVLGVEVRKYEGKNIKALVPRVVGQTESARQEKGRPRKITPDEFLSLCDEKSREFFLELISAAEADGYKVEWGTKGFSLRIFNKEGIQISLFYGYVPGFSGGDRPPFQAYFAQIEEEKRERFRKKLSEYADFKLKGQYTPEVILTPEISDSLKPKLRELLKAAKEIVTG